MLDFLENIDDAKSNINKCLFYKNKVNKWMGDTLNEDKELPMLKGQLAKLYHELGFIVTHSLIAALDNKDPKIRNLAMWGLGFLKDPQSIKFLRRILMKKKAKKEVRAAALTVLLEIGEDTDIFIRNLGESPLCKDILCNFICLLDEPMARDQIVDVFLNFPNTVQKCILRAIERQYHHASGMFLFEVYNNNMSLSDDVNKLVKKLLYRAGMEINIEEKQNRKSLLSSFYKAWASCTRDEGIIHLFIVWTMPDDYMKVMYCILDFVNEGIVEFSVDDNLIEEELSSELIELLGDEEGSSVDDPGYDELNCEEVLCLFRDIRDVDGDTDFFYVSGYERYRWLFAIESDLTPEGIDLLMHKLMYDPNAPSTIISAYYAAQARGDYLLLYSTFSEKYKGREGINRNEFRKKINGKLLKNREIYHGFKICDLRKDEGDIIAQCEVVINNDGIYMCKLERLHLIYENGMWKIVECDEINCYHLHEETFGREIDDSSKTKNDLTQIFNSEAVEAIGISYERDDNYFSK